MINQGTYHGLNGINQRGKFGCLQRLCKKAMQEVLVALFPARNSFTLSLTVRGKETATFGLLEFLRDVVSERSSERKKPTSINFHIH